MSEATATEEQTIDDRILLARKQAVSSTRFAALDAVAIFFMLSMSIMMFANSHALIGFSCLLSASAFLIVLYSYVGVLVMANLLHRELLSEKYSKN